MSWLFNFTHKELVEIAYKWALKRGGCGAAFKELKSVTSEIPDVIGFGSGFSIVIECKVSRADFLKDKKKPHRQKGMGTFRYFCCPDGLIKVDELPEKWGLLCVNPDGSYKLEKNPKKERNTLTSFVFTDSNDYYTRYYPNSFQRNMDAENKLMYSIIRRLFIKGFAKHVYDKNYHSPSDPDTLIKINHPHTGE